MRKQPQRGDMLVGYRFDLSDLPDWTSADPPIRPGAGFTAVANAMPIAGPIFFQDHQGSPWARYSAQCAGCGGSSKCYKTRHAGIRQWAHRHRCNRRVELGYVVHQNTGIIGLLDKDGNPS